MKRISFTPTSRDQRLLPMIVDVVGVLRFGAPIVGEYAVGVRTP